MAPAGGAGAVAGVGGAGGLAAGPLSVRLAGEADSGIALTACPSAPTAISEPPRIWVSTRLVGRGATAAYSAGVHPSGHSVGSGSGTKLVLTRSPAMVSRLSRTGTSMVVGAAPS